MACGIIMATSGKSRCQNRRKDNDEASYERAEGKDR